MKTALVTTSYLIPENRYEKTTRFIKYYKDMCPQWDIIVFDNASPIELIRQLSKETNPKEIKAFTEHFDRPSLLDYKYLWRAVWYIKDLFENYDKVIYMDNDFYVLSQKMIDYIEDLESGWTTFWCNLYGFPETGCHIIHKDCDEYWNFVKSPLEYFIAENNNTVMENVLPVTHIERHLVGDRYGEFEVQPSAIGKDFWAQAQLEDRFYD